MPSSRGSSPPKDQTQNSRLLHWWAGSLPLEPRGKPKYVLLLCCPVLSCSVMSDSATIWNVARQTPLSIGILQAKILEWVAMPSSRGYSQPGIEPRSPILQADCLSRHQGRPISPLIISNLFIFQSHLVTILKYTAIKFDTLKPGKPVFD